MPPAPGPGQSPPSTAGDAAETSASAFRADLFAGRRLAITGGATGIGLAISRAFAAHGADVHIISRNEERLSAAVQQVEQHARAGGGASYHVADVRDAERLRQVAEDVGPVDVLVNCAAGNFPSPFSALSANAWDAVLDIVLGGTVHATRAFGEPMLAAASRRAQGAGGRAEGAAATAAHAADAPGACIINIVAGYAWTGAPGVSHSGAAKAGVLNLTKSLAVEWAPHVRVNAVSPGPIGDTEGMKRLGEDLGLADAVVRSIPLRRMGMPEEVAAACLFLASPAASFVTGACLVVDGGQDAKGPFGDILLG